MNKGPSFDLKCPTTPSTVLSELSQRLNGTGLPTLKKALDFEINILKVDPLLPVQKGHEHRKNAHDLPARVRAENRFRVIHKLSAAGSGFELAPNSS